MHRKIIINEQQFSDIQGIIKEATRRRLSVDADELGKYLNQQQIPPFEQQAIRRLCQSKPDFTTKATFTTFCEELRKEEEKIIARAQPEDIKKFELGVKPIDADNIIKAIKSDILTTPWSKQGSPNYTTKSGQKLTLPKPAVEMMKLIDKYEANTNSLPADTKKTLGKVLLIGREVANTPLPKRKISFLSFMNKNTVEGQEATSFFSKFKDGGTYDYFEQEQGKKYRFNLRKPHKS